MQKVIKITWGNPTSIMLFRRIDFGIFMYSKLENVIFGLYVERISDFFNIIFRMLYLEVYITWVI